MNQHLKKQQFGPLDLAAVFLAGLLFPSFAVAGDGDLGWLFIGAIFGCVLSLCIALFLPAKALAKLAIFLLLTPIISWPSARFADDFFRTKIQERNATYDEQNHCYKSTWPARAGDYPNCK